MAAHGHSGEPVALRILVAVLDPEMRDLVISELDRTLPAVIDAVEDLGQAAARLVDSRYDAIVADAALPDFEDPMLLRLARDTQPDAVRIGVVADDRPRAALALLAHVVVSRDALPEGLGDIVRRSVSLHRSIDDPLVRSQVSQCVALPSTPTLYAELVGVLATDDDAVQATSAVVERDQEIAARVLQLTNSAFMGRTRPTTDVTTAVAWLGMPAVRGLVLSLEVVRTVKRAAPESIDIVERLQAHALDVAQTMRIVAGRDLDAYAAGLLHDIGRLVLLANDAERFDRAERRVADGQSRRDAEIKEYGCAHDDVGAALLAQWGLPRRLVEAVAGHHRPAELAVGLDLTGTLHVANALAYDDAWERHLDSEWAADMQVNDLLETWRAAMSPQH